MGSDSKYVAPADAAELYRNYGDYVQGLVRKQLGASGNLQDAEDIAADILEKLISARNGNGENALEQYDPGFVHPATGQHVTWRAFLSGKVVLYVRGKREKVTRRNYRELLQLDAPAGDGTPWVEVFGGAAQWDDYAVLEDNEFADRMREHLACLPDFASPVSALAAFDELVSCLRDDRRPTLSGLGLTRAQRGEVSRLLREAVSSPPPPGRCRFVVEGVTLSAVEMREAADALRAARGNHVHSALKAHRLQLEGPKGWYHSFSAVERRLFPEVCTDPRTHRQPADHVKRAVIHRLERMLAEAGCPAAEPEPEVTRDELLEAELWHIKGLSAAQVDAVIDAVHRVLP